MNELQDVEAHGHKGQKKDNVTSRRWCFTAYRGPLMEQKGAFQWDNKVSYAIYSLERCPTSGRLHMQGYLELHTPMKFGGVKKLLGDNSVHLENAKGTSAQNNSYCSKPKSHVEGPWNFGEPSAGAGERTDLKATTRLLKQQGLDAVIDQQPHIYMKYHRGIEKLDQHYAGRSPPNRDVTIYGIAGCAGVGKTRWTYENFGFENVYSLSKPTKGGTVWFDGYRKQDVLLIDDYRGWLDFSFLLHLLDRYPLQLQVKGGTCWAHWTKVVITSNVKIDAWHPGQNETNMNALWRRISYVSYLFPGETLGPHAGFYTVAELKAKHTPTPVVTDSHPEGSRGHEVVGNTMPPPRSPDEDPQEAYRNHLLAELARLPPKPVLQPQLHPQIHASVNPNS